MTETHTLASRLKAARKRAGLTKAQLAKQAGISQPTYCDLERGVHEGSKHLVQIAECLNTSAEWLSTGVIKQPKNIPDLSEEWIELFMKIEAQTTEEKIKTLKILRAMLDP